MKIPKKLIEVALPLDAINNAATQEKGNPFLKGHPRNLHQWWARRPMAAARAVIFAQLVNDPGYQQGSGFKYGKNKKDAAEERKRLFKIIEDIVLWENTTNDEVFTKARAEIKRSWEEICELNRSHPQAAELFNPDNLPPFHDPFAGGGAIPLEAQRLGLDSSASDLNPVAVLLNKAMVEIPPKFLGHNPVGPESSKLGLKRDWHGTSGLAEDVRRYGRIMKEEVEKAIGDLYPQVEITKEMSRLRDDLKLMVGKKLTVNAYIWARTVKSPNPVFSHIDVPLVSTFILSAKEGKESYIEPIVEGSSFRFTVKSGTLPEKAKKGTSAGKRSGFICLMSNSPIDYSYIRSEAKAGRMGQKLMAVIAEGDRRRVYLEPTAEMEHLAKKAIPLWKPDCEMPKKHRNFQPPVYGMDNIGDIFTARQLVALNTFSDFIAPIRQRIITDAISAGYSADSKSLESGGRGAHAYADAISLFLALSIDKIADYSNTLCLWNPTNQNIGHLFTKQAIPMSWDFVEMNPINGPLSFDAVTEGVSKTIEKFPQQKDGHAFQADCAEPNNGATWKIISTDPPYYDNICYADLSDFFYVWLRKSLRQIFPDLLSTISVPKTQELIAASNRHTGKDAAEKFFLDGMTRAMHQLSTQTHPAFPVSIYYAFKQSETTAAGTVSTGWETFLEAVLRAGFAITGTWPLRTERATRAVGQGANALASSIVLVCRKRQDTAPTISRREFIRELNAILPEALVDMTSISSEGNSPVAPVDLSQAIIGPGMAVFSKYSAVLEADGKPMSVHTALQLINRFLTEDDFDKDTQFCLHWFETQGWKEGQFGEADVAARAKGTSVNGLAAAGVVYSGGGKVRLLKWSDYPVDWDPANDTRLPIWEALHQLIRALRTGGDTSAGVLISKLGTKIEAIRQLAYRLYTLCERKGWAEDARAYNELIASWQAIEAVAPQVKEEKQAELF